MEIFLGGFIIACFAAAVCDFLVFKIPNAILAFIIVLFVIKILIFHSVTDLLWPFITFAAVLLAGFMLYSFKWIGPGDAKFVAATSLWASQIDLLLFLLMMSISGGVLAAVYLKFHLPIFAVQQKLLSSLKSVPYFEETLASNDEKAKSRPVIPYGVAVFLGILFLYLNKILTR